MSKLREEKNAAVQEKEKLQHDIVSINYLSKSEFPHKQVMLIVLCLLN